MIIGRLIELQLLKQIRVLIKRLVFLNDFEVLARKLRRDEKVHMPVVLAEPLNTFRGYCQSSRAEKARNAVVPLRRFQDRNIEFFQQMFLAAFCLIAGLQI